MSDPIIRLASRDDALAVSEIYSPFCQPNSHISFEIVAPSPDEIRDRIEKTIAHFPWLVAVADGETVGYAYATTHNERAAYRWSVNTALYVKAGRRRAGTGRALYDALLSALRVLGFVNAYAGVALPNDASIGLHRALRFELVGIYKTVGFKAGAWRDTAWWHRTLMVPPLDPEPPLSLSGKIGTTEWDDALLFRRGPSLDGHQP